MATGTAGLACDGNQMTAVQFEPGNAEGMYLKQIPVPEVKKGEVLVKVSATAINRADTLQRRGLYPNPPGSSPILGLEAAGVVEQLGEGTSGLSVGDRVMCLLTGGGYAEYTAVPYQQCMPVPDNFSMTEAAAIPETWLTGYQLLHKIAKVQRGDYVLIHAGASGVGSAVIQMCNLVGAKAIVTVGSQEKIDHCKSLGASFGVNYKQGKFDEAVKEFVESDSNGKKKGVDVALDCVGGGTHAEQTISALAMDSRWVLYGLMGGRMLEKFNLGAILGKRIQLTGTTLRSRSLDYKTDLVSSFSREVLPSFSGERRNMKPIIDTVLPLSDVVKAHQLMEANKNKGKIVLTV